MYKKDTLFFGIIFSWIISGFFDIFVYNFVDPFCIELFFVGILFITAMLLTFSKRFRDYMLQESRIYRRLFFKKKK